MVKKERRKYYNETSNLKSKVPGWHEVQAQPLPEQLILPENWIYNWNLKSRNRKRNPFKKLRKRKPGALGEVLLSKFSMIREPLSFQPICLYLLRVFVVSQTPYDILPLKRFGYQDKRSIPRAPRIAKLDELHPLNIVALAHHQVQDATHYLPEKIADYLQFR